MDVENAKYDPSTTATVYGRSGLFAGEEAILHLGQCLVVGRSRMCDVSVARTAECLRLGKEALERHRSYRKISRKHLRICMPSDDLLEVEDLSTNGTVVEGHRVDRIVISGFRSGSKTVTVEFGDGELLEVTPGGPQSKAPSEVQTENRSSSHVGHEDVPSSVDRTPV